MFKSTKEWLPIESIECGLIKRKDRFFCKILEIYPVNFKLKSFEEQEKILYAYKTFLRTCNFDMQILIKSKRSEIESHLKAMEIELKNEKDILIKKMMANYTENLKNEIKSKKIISRKFFIIIKYKAISQNAEADISGIYAELNERATKIKETLSKCGNKVIDYEKDNKKIAELLYKHLNKSTSERQKLVEQKMKREGKI